jgi:hypothetical protein
LSGFPTSLVVGKFLLKNFLSSCFIISFLSLSGDTPNDSESLPAESKLFFALMSLIISETSFSNFFISCCEYVCCPNVCLLNSGLISGLLKA